MKNKNQTKIPLVSVVMPAYNSEKYIGESIESILNQTYKNFEFIIINDASTDKTLKIIKEYAKKDKRIKIIENKKNLGNYGARNVGIFNSKGEFVAQQDADDISMRDRLKKQLKIFEKNPEVGVVGAFVELFNEKTKKIISIRKYSTKDKELRKNIFYFSPIAQGVSMLRKEVFIKTGGYNGRYKVSEDLDLWFRVGTYYKFSNVPEILLKYRIHEESITNKKRKLVEKNANRIRRQNWDNQAYHFGLKEFLYNFLHFISIYTIPSKFKIWLFIKLRDKNK